MTATRDERLQELFTRTKMGMTPGLELVRELLAALGDPQERFLSVHVAGTNGKGSTCALLEQGLRTLGLKTGLFTSPHLVRVNERIRLNGLPVEEEDLDRWLGQVQEVEPTLSRLPTFFETLTAVAFLAFAHSGVQVAVLETGMGGRLDSTNVVTPLVSVITRVDMDHQQYLGTTLTAIAGEKAGILKPGRPAVIGAQALEAESVLRTRAEALECPLCLAPLTVTISGRKQTLEGQQFHLSTDALEVGRVRTRLMGAYQMENIATAVAALEVAADQLSLPLDADTVKTTLAETCWAARGEVVSIDPPVIVDVAHNPGGAKALSELLIDLFGRKAKGTFVLASMKDKDTDKVLQVLKPHIETVWCVSVESERSRSAEELVDLAAAVGLAAVPKTLEEARALIQSGQVKGGFACITGSVYLAGAWTETGPVHRGEA